MTFAGSNYEQMKNLQVGPNQNSRQRIAVATNWKSMEHIPAQGKQLLKPDTHKTVSMTT